MSGDGGGKKKSSNNNDKADENAVPSYLGGGVNSTFPQAMPGQLNALAQQLTAGFGAPVAQNLSFLEALYSPMNVHAKPAVAAPAKPGAKPASKPSVAANMPRRELSRGGNR